VPRRIAQPARPFARLMPGQVGGIRGGDGRRVDPGMMRQLVFVGVAVSAALGVAAACLPYLCRIDRRTQEANLARLAAARAPAC
jgi:hypothetical protein